MASPVRTDEVVAALAAVERYYGRAFVHPPGPRRERNLRWASSYGAISVSSEACSCCGAELVIEEDGRIFWVDGEPWDP